MTAVAITGRACSRPPRPSRGGAGRTARPRASRAAADVDRDGARVERRRVAPDARHQLVAREDAPRVAREEPEEVELLRRQPHLAARLPHVARPALELDVAEAELLVVDPGRRRAAQDALHARRELAGRERLRDVVVRAELEPDDAVRLLAAGGQHDHREVRARADPAAELEPVRAREHHVEDDEVGLGALDRVAGGVAVARLERPVPFAGEVADDHLANDRLVVDHENGRHRRILLRRALRRGEFMPTFIRA